MTRCGIRTCTLPEHRDRPLPYGWKYRNDYTSDLPIRTIPGRTDPGYDQPGPPRRSDLSLVVIVQGFVVFVAIVLFCFLASLVEVGS